MRRFTVRTKHSSRQYFSDVLASTVKLEDGVYIFSDRQGNIVAFVERSEVDGVESKPVEE